MCAKSCRRAQKGQCQQQILQMISGVRKGVWQTFGVVSSTPPPRPEHLVLMAVFACPSCPRNSSKKNLPCVTTLRGLQFRLRQPALILQLSASVWTTQLKYSLSRRHGGCKTRSLCACRGRENHPRRTPSRSRRDKAFRFENTCGRFSNETLAR